MRRFRYGWLVILLGLGALVYGFQLFSQGGAGEWAPCPQAEEEALRVLNQFREEEGLPLLEQSEELAQAARARALEMVRAGELDHTRPDGREFYTALEEAGASYRICGENLAYLLGNEPAGLAGDYWITQWKESPDHLENLSDPRFTRAGTAIYHRETGQGYEFYAVQLYSGDLREEQEGET